MENGGYRGGRRIGSRAGGAVDTFNDDFAQVSSFELFPSFSVDLFVFASEGGQEKGADTDQLGSIVGVPTPKRVTPSEADKSANEVVLR